MIRLPRYVPVLIVLLVAGLCAPALKGEQATGTCVDAVLGERDWVQVTESSRWRNVLTVRASAGGPPCQTEVETEIDVNGVVTRVAGAMPDWPLVDTPTTPPPPPPPPPPQTPIEVKLDQIIGLLTQPPMTTCQVTAVGSYANGDQRLTVRCAPAGYLVGPVEIRKK